MANEGSWWIFVNPLTSPVLIFLLQLALTLSLTRLLGKLFSYIKQPQVIGEIIGGIILGPSAMGQIPGFTAAVFPTAVPLSSTQTYNSVVTFTVIANVGLIFFMFLMGAELDRKHLRKQLKSSFPIATAAIVFPFALGALASLWLYNVNAEGQPASWTPPTELNFILFTAASFSFTAFPVLASILKSSGLNHTDLGVQALACASIGDVMAWCVLAVASSFAKSGQPLLGLYTCLVSAGYVVVTIFILKPLLQVGHTFLEKRNKTQNRYYFCFLMVFVICNAFATEVIGIHAFFGAFLAGLVMPQSKTDENFAETLIERMELVIMEIFLPLYFVSSGIRTNIGALNQGIYWLYTLAIIAIACFGKFVPTLLTSRLLTKASWRQCGVLGVLMNTRGLVEVIVLNIGLTLGILSEKLFTMMILMAIITTMMTSPLLWAFWLRHPPVHSTDETSSDPEDGLCRSQCSHEPTATAAALDQDAPADPEKDHKAAGSERPAVDVGKVPDV